MSLTILSMDVFYRYVPNILLNPSYTSYSPKPLKHENYGIISRLLRSLRSHKEPPRKCSLLEELQACRDTSGSGSILMGILIITMEQKIFTWFMTDTHGGSFGDWQWGHVWCVPATVWLMKMMEAIVSMFVSKDVYLRLIQNPTSRIGAIAQRESKNQLLIGMEALTVCLCSNLLFFLAVYGVGQINLFYRYFCEIDVELLSPAHQVQLVKSYKTNSTYLFNSIVARYWYSSLGGAFGSILVPGGGGRFVFVGMWLGEIYAQEEVSSSQQSHNIMLQDYDFSNNKNSSSSATTNHSINRRPTTYHLKIRTSTTALSHLIKNLFQGFGLLDLFTTSSKRRPVYDNNRSKHNNNHQNYYLQDDSEFTTCGCCHITKFSSQTTSLSAPIASASCGHTICRSCVNKYHSSIYSGKRCTLFLFNRQEWLPCPLCKASNSFVMTDLRINYSLCTALEWIEQEKKRHDALNRRNHVVPPTRKD